jgi:hypothetical protein
MVPMLTCVSVGSTGTVSATQETTVSEQGVHPDLENLLDRYDKICEDYQANDISREQAATAISHLTTTDANGHLWGLDTGGNWVRWTAPGVNGEVMDPSQYRSAADVVRGGSDPFASAARGAPGAFVTSGAPAAAPQQGRAAGAPNPLDKAMAWVKANKVMAAAGFVVIVAVMYMFVKPGSEEGAPPVTTLPPVSSVPLSTAPPTTAPPPETTTPPPTTKPPKVTTPKRGQAPTVERVRVLVNDLTSANLRRVRAAVAQPGNRAVFRVQAATWAGFPETDVRVRPREMRLVEKVPTQKWDLRDRASGDLIARVVVRYTKQDGKFVLQSWPQSAD